jgi:hypothetical protein
MATTMCAYLDQLAVSARPATLVSADTTLRLFAGRVSDTDPACRSVAAIGRGHVEDYKVWLAARPGNKAATLSATTIRNCLGTLRTFFERIIEWGYNDAPDRVPVYANDLPPSRRATAPLPRRPHRRQVHGHPGHRTQPPPPPRGRAAGPHRHARR